MYSTRLWIRNSACALSPLLSERNTVPRLASELRQQPGVKVTVIPADLASSDAVEDVIAEVKNLGIKINVLVNNAGLGIFENFLEASVAKQMNQVDVNVRAVVTLAHARASTSEIGCVACSERETKSAWSPTAE